MHDAQEERMLAGLRDAATRLCAGAEPLTLSAQERRDLGDFLFDVAAGWGDAIALKMSALCAAAQHMPRDLL